MPGLHLVTWSVLGGLSITAVAVGVRRHRPRQPVAWWLAAAGMAAFVAGATAYAVLTEVLKRANPVPSVADALYLAMYPLLAAALLVAVRARRPGPGRGELLDALIITAGIAVPVWEFLVAPYVATPGLSLPARLVAVGYPLGDLLLLLVLGQLLAAGGGRIRSVQLLAIGTVTLLSADVSYGLSQLAGTWRAGTAVDLGWAAFYATWGAAALHPSMTRVTTPLPGDAPSARPLRLAMVGLSGLVTPALLIVEDLRGDPRNAGPLAALSAAIFSLVLLRLARTISAQRRSTQREHALRRAASDLVAAADLPAVGEAVRRAVTVLAPGRLTGALALPDLPSEGPLLDLGIVPPPVLDQLRHRPALLPMAAAGPELAARLGTASHLLLCPVAAAGGSAGVVVAAGDLAALATAHDLLQTLAAQAALALARLELSRTLHHQESEAQFRSLIEHARDLVVVVDDNDAVRYATPATPTVLGYRPDRLVGLPFGRLLAIADRPAAELALRRFRRLPDSANRTVEWRLARADGALLDVEVVCANRTGDPAVGGLVLTMRDMTERRRLQRELRHRSLHDGLTGLPTRLLYTERLTHALVRGRRPGTRPAVTGVLVLDLDDFKSVNDRYGYAVGDRALGQIAARLRSVLRPADTLARLGGDEFAVLVEELGDPAEVEEIAGRLVEALQAPVVVAGHQLVLGASIGVAVDADGPDAEALLRVADLARYAAKEGKAGWRLYDRELHVGSVERLRQRAQLEEALGDGQFRLHYQPIVALGSRELVGMEALVRWQQPDRLVNPQEFIQLAEDTNLIIPLGSWVLRTALGQLAEWRREFAVPESVRICVNVSARQVNAPGFAESVSRALREAGLPPTVLTLELTETVLIEHEASVDRALGQLRRLGVRLAIDDFGTGYSSLAYLRHFPVSTLKIDRCFTQYAVHSVEQRTLVDVIIRMARAFDLDVTAEGIEEEAQAAVLAELGCDHGQGFLFGHPLTAAELRAELGARFATAPAAVAVIAQRQAS